MMTYAATHASYRSMARSLMLIILLALFTSYVVAKGRLDGFTPSALSHGAPVGSFSLTDFEQVNPYNGSISFAFPLYTVVGRGGAQYTMTLPIDDKWIVENHTLQDCSDPFNGCYTEYIYNPFRAGTTNGYRQWSLRMYEAGTMIGRREQIYALNPNCGACVLYGGSLTRLTFILPDGTEMELRDDKTKGQPFEGRYAGISMNTNPTTGFPRGKVFVTADGTAATFVSNTEITDLVPYGNASSPPSDIIYPSGYLMLSDGTRYDIDRGSVTSMRDSNGNRLSFEYDQTYTGPSKGKLLAVTDSLGRRVTIEYNVQANSDEPYGLHDKIIFKGFGGDPKIVRVSKTTLRNSLRSGYSVRQFKLLFPELNLRNNSFAYNTNYNADFDPQVYTSIWLPDKRSYKFLYNDYAELSRVELPTGGAVEYDTKGGVKGGTQSGVIGNPNVSLEIYRRVVERRTYHDGGSGIENKITFSRPDQVTGSTVASLNYIDVDQINTANDLGESLGVERHYYHGNALQSLQTLTDAANWPRTRYPAWNEGKEYQTELIAADRVTLLKRITQTWQQRAPVGWWPSNYPQSSAPANDPRVINVVTTLADVTPNLVSKKTAIDPQNPNNLGFDQFNNQTDAWEYDYGQGAAGTLVRHIHTDYLTVNPVNSLSYTDTDVHLRRLVKEQRIYSFDPLTGAETLAAAHNNEYDNYGRSPLLDRASISGLDPLFNTSYTQRGNPTRISRWLNDDGAGHSLWINEDAQFDIAGNVVKTTDPRGKETVFDFSDCFGFPDNEARANVTTSELGAQASYAHPTVVTNALGHKVYTQYDYYTGLTVNGEDANGVISSANYNDVLGRPTQVTTAVNTGVQKQTTFNYDDDNHLITTTSDLYTFGDNQSKSEMLYDGLGRTIEIRQFEGPSYIATRQEYDYMGRAYKVSNAFRPSEETPVWTTTEHDELGRVTSVTSPDGAQSRMIYSGHVVTAVDQTGKTSINISDAFGRLKQVTEAPGSLNYHTTYEYDVLDNLRRVTQGTQSRIYNYDSMSRLRTSTNPDSGTVTYHYDVSGSMDWKTDARGVKTSYEYDDLNRLKTRSYSLTGEMPPNYVASPNTEYFYDGAGMPANTPVPPFSKGKLTAVKSAVSQTLYTEFDAVGNTRKHRQVSDPGTLKEKVYSMAYGYDLAGHITLQVYPSGRRIDTVFDSASRITEVSGGFGGADNYTYPDKDGNSGSMLYVHIYADSFKYASHGAVKSMRLGNDLWERTDYNSRLQPTLVGLGTQRDSVDRLALNYDYGTSNNNGVVQKQIITFPAINGVAGINLTQTYSYDQVNRLNAVSETGGTNPWTQTYTYTDADGTRGQFGNRRIDAATTTPGLTPASNPTFNPTNNQFAANQGYEYDAVGNVKTALGVSHSFDSENRMVSVNDGQSLGLSTYSYDGDGRRVKKVRNSGSVTTTYVYNILGQLIAEYSDNIEPGDGGISYLTQDNLGTPRVISDDRGAVIARHDYLPFGEELGREVPLLNGRMPEQQYVTDKVSQKFTQKERDIETGLDYFGARYYSSHLGRFTTTDPVNLTSARLTDPQQLNPYAYARNNPLIFVDPDGKDIHLYMSAKPVGTTTIRLIGSRDVPGAPKTVEVAVYELTVTDDVTKGTSTYLITRDAPIVTTNWWGSAVTKGPFLDGSNYILEDYRHDHYNVLNTAFEPKADVGTYKLVPFEYPPNSGLPAYALRNPDGSGQLDAEPNDSPYRTQRGTATSIILHVGGLYRMPNGDQMTTGSEGCFCFAGESAGNQGVQNFADDINRRMAANRKAKKGTNIFMQIQKRRDVLWRWQVAPGGERH